MEPAPTSSAGGTGACGVTTQLFITVIVPVRNELESIERTLLQLASQDYDAQRFEILVVDGESTDATPRLVEDFARKHPNVRLLCNPRWLSSAARNIGLRHAQGDVVLVVDGHCEIPDHEMLKHLAQAFETSGADCVGRPQPLDVTDATPLQRAIAAARSSWLGHHPDSYIYSSKPQFVPAGSVAVAYRREVFEKVGYFDERFDACEDYEFNHRVDQAGLRCFFAPETAVRYFPRNTLRGLFRQLFRYGRGRVRLWKKHPSMLSFGTMIPAAFVAGVAGGWIPGLFVPTVAVAYVAILLAYVLVVLSFSASLAFQHRRPALTWLVPAVFATIHAACGCGVLAELLAPRKREAVGSAPKTSRDLKAPSADPAHDASNIHRVHPNAHTHSR